MYKLKAMKTFTVFEYTLSQHFMNLIMQRSDNQTLSHIPVLVYDTNINFLFVQQFTVILSSVSSLTQMIKPGGIYSLFNNICSLFNQFTVILCTASSFVQMMKPE